MSSCKRISLTYKMNCFDKEFITELFLDSDSVNTLNRLVVAAANVVCENNENVMIFNEALGDESSHVLHDISNASAAKFSVKSRRGYYEHNVLKFTDEDYIDRFKMRKATIQALIKFLNENAKLGTSMVSLDKKVHIFIWLMTSNLSYNVIGSLFGLHPSSVSHIFQEMASLLTEYKYHFISWPSIEEQHITGLKVNSRFQFPNCVGFIDACQFKIGFRKNKKDYLSTVLLQAVCDESLMFIDIHVGSIGKTKKSKVFKESNLSQELKNFVDFDNHILGDSEYKMRKNLITPFTSEEVLTSEEMKFNEVHWKARSYIGHAFDLLKRNFRKLSHLDVSKPDVVESVICAASILHNFKLLHEGCPEIKEEAIICEEGVTMDQCIVKTATEKRQFLCNYVNYIETTLER